MDASTSARVWERLVSGEPLDGLGLRNTNGRLDLRGLLAPEPGVVREFAAPTGDVKVLSNLVVIRGVEWRGLDFGSARLDSLRFHDCSIDDCSFEGARCHDWRMWGTAISNTSFRSADLRESAMGGIDKMGKRNSFHRVDFTEADLRGTAHKSSDMVECTFRNTNLSKVDFQGTVFVDCTFEGKLEDVLFYRHAFRGEGFPPNEMARVDLSGAKLHHVEFRGLDMATVKWPEDDEHVIVDDYVSTLERVVAALEARAAPSSMRVAAGLRFRLKWAGPNQRRGVLNKAELMERGGDEVFGEVLRIVRPN